MPTKDGFTPDHPLPVFLSDYAAEFEQPGIGKAWDGAAIASRILKMSVLAVAAMAIAVLWLGNPLAIFANVTASLVDMTTSQPGGGQSTPAIQSTAQALPPTATDATAREQIATPAEPANQVKAENSEPPAEDVLKQFQAWAAEEDTRAPVVAAEPAPQPVQPAQVVQDDQAQVDEDAQAPVRHMRRHRRIRPVQSARAEIRPVQNPRAKLRREQNARALVRPAQDARAPDPAVQNAQPPQPPSLLQSLGLHN
jgi:hypothetical protein